MENRSGSSSSELPVRLQPLSDSAELMGIWAQQVAARSAEAQVLTGLLDYRGQIAAEVAEEHLFYRRAADKAAVHDAAQMLAVADLTAAAILNSAGFIRTDLPKTWQQFSAGLIDLPRLRKIAVAAIMLPADQPELITTLDVEVSVIAPEMTAAELAHWLNRRIPELDTEAFQQQAEEALARRYVRIEHHTDGTSCLEALLPTIEAAAIQKRLRKVAAGMDTPQPADPPPADPDHGEADVEAVCSTADTGTPVDGRTRAQREADLFSAWLRTGTSYGAPVDAKICVLIPETTLTTAENQPGVSADRSYVIPADQARKLAADPHAEHQWYTATTWPNPAEADHDILSITYQGRFAPARLKDAIIFRDGVCQAQGCTVPAERCDLDHQQPHHTGGETTGTNIWALCRRHHQMKSHGYLPTPHT